MTQTTSATDGTPMTAQVEQTWLKLVAVKEQIAELEKVEEELAQQLRTTLGRGTYTCADGPPLTIFATRRFDPALAAKVLPPALLESVQRTVVDAKLLKAKLAEEGLPIELYELCQTERGKDTVRELK
jgi:hypothetical protein